MHYHAEKTEDNNDKMSTNAHPKRETRGESTFQFVDNRPESIAQKKLQEIITNSPQTIPKKENIIQLQPDLDGLSSDVTRLIARKLVGQDYISYASTNREQRRRLGPGERGEEGFQRALKDQQKVNSAVEEARRAGSRFQARKRRLGKFIRKGKISSEIAERALEILKKEKKN